jgi:hypothetical protein
MHCPSGNIAPLPCTERLRRTTLRQRHFSLQNNMRRLAAMRVIGIKGIRSILPHVRTQKSFPMKLPFQRF